MILKRELYQRHGYFKGILIVLSFQISRLFKLFLSLFKKDDGRLTVNEDQKLSKYKGMLALTVNKQGDIQCTGCGLCQAVCPSDCIDIQFDKKKKGVGAFNIDLLRCVFCGLCEEACPIDGIRHTAEIPSPGHFEQNWNVGISTLAYRKSLNNGNGLLSEYILDQKDLDLANERFLEDEGQPSKA